MKKSQMEKVQLALQLFTPRQAIKSADHLAGRSHEIGKVLTAILQPGAHAIVYGDRGVGKTSLANCVTESLANTPCGPFVLPLVNCDTGDSYSTVWKKVFSEIDIEGSEPVVGFGANSKPVTVPALATMPGELAPYDVQKALSHLGGRNGVVVVLDEFDRLPADEPTRLMADTIKMLSDQSVPATVVVIGVGDSVSSLIRGHESITRHLVEVLVPRLTREERMELFSSRLDELEMTMDERMTEALVTTSRGLPYYAHLLGQKAAISAIVEDSTEIRLEHVTDAIRNAVKESERALHEAYYDATRSNHPRAKYAHTLAACALAKCDDFGYFTPKDVVPALASILGEERTAGSFVERLEKMASDDRGNVLVSTGRKYDRRFRFRDPLLQPYVVMKSMADGLISLDQIIG